MTGTSNSNSAVNILEGPSDYTLQLGSLKSSVVKRGLVNKVSVESYGRSSTFKANMAARSNKAPTP